jgi:hypothetical protein
VVSESFCERGEVRRGHGVGFVVWNSVATNSSALAGKHGFFSLRLEKKR